MAASPKSSTTINTKLVRELADILSDTDLTEIEVEKGELRVRVARKMEAAPVYQAAAPAPMAAPAAAPAAAAPAAAAPAPSGRGDATPDGATPSPMVGTVYLRANPDADIFVNVGDEVKEGDTILLIEAMKTFNPITAPRSGKLTHMLVEEAQPVEYGEPLFVIA
ncbi:acetyl-CoA carboxylase biotin carboxyl carrier protein [Hyphobacterium marinum]|uniref:Biotin carboxyl carrier protein of acetyl-CoA carboxylase n=1 Tax=Hyphobacterium marinum TaxID=3116574 RepID=A0ABU7M128_9PROT|nr:acetyl-CoA carboxylase biotin carboxyl carrier protein [Hyphobacterium sp. Y6023]MEE2567227.1 acetyl-CoA carboxylase biotin carboxyl carrier protein [Hyphobacterium sp. Y6023]